MEAVICCVLIVFFPSHRLTVALGIFTLWEKVTFSKDNKYIEIML